MKPKHTMGWHGQGLRRERWYGYYFMAPAMLLTALLIAIPLGRAVWTSLFRSHGLRSTFVGLANYAYLLSRDEFWNGLRVSAIFTVIAVCLHLALGLILALALNSIVFGRRLLRIGFLAPWIVAPSIGAVTWVWLLDPQFGVVNSVLSSLGLIQTYQSWLGTPELAIWAVIIVNVWHSTPFVMLLMLAGLQGIPRDQYEAALIDGTNRWQRLRYITLPNLRYLLVVASTLDFIYTIRDFDTVSVMTGGGPVGSTEVLPVLIYNTAFTQNDFGRASAMGILLLGIILIFSAGYLRAVRAGRAAE